MFGKPFYFSLIRKYVILMGTLLNDIRITRTDKDGNVTALLKVPITYAAKDKMPRLRQLEQACWVRKQVISYLSGTSAGCLSTSILSFYLLIGFYPLFADDFRLIVDLSQS